MLIEAIGRDFRYAARSFGRTPAASAAAVCTLALGIAATTAMFSVAYAALLRAAPFPQPERIVILFKTAANSRERSTRVRWSYPNIVQLSAIATSFESLASFSSPLLSISGDGDPEHVDGEIVSPRYFDVLRTTTVAGRTFRADEDVAAAPAPVAIISTRLWTRRFAGDASVVGRTLRVNDVPLTIIGVLPAGFAGLSGKADVWITPSLAPYLTYADYLTTAQNFISVVARLKDGVSVAQAQSEMATIGARFALPSAGTPADTVWSATAVPLGEARIDATARRSALVLFGAAIGVLLIACVNVACLLLARARTRRREIAVRLAIGSSRGRLVRQLLAEGALLAACAGALGTLLAAWGVALLVDTAPEIIASGRNNYGAIAAFASPSFDLRTLTFALAVALGTTLLFALAPAIDASRADLTTALKDNDRGSGRQGRALSALVVAEVALACVLLCAAGVLIESFARIQQRRAGFVSDGVLTFWVRPPASRYPPADGPASLDRLLARVESVPGVEAAAVNRCTPFSGCSRTMVFFPDRPADPSNAPVVGRHYVSPDYFRALGIPLLAGRLLTSADRIGSRPVALVNESGARRFWPGERSLGKRVWFGTTTGPFSDAAHAVEIVGIVGDVKYETVEDADAARPEFYTSYLQFAYPDTMVIVKARGRASALVPAMRRAVASVDPALPIHDVMTLDERIASAMARPRFNAALLTAFAAVALLLAAVGVYGVLSYAVSTRMRELGVRLALGASPRRLVWLLVGEGVRRAGVGAAIGIAAALGAARVLQSIVIGASAANPLVLGIAIVVMVGVSALAAFLPARRVQTLDPVSVLRHE